MADGGWGRGQIRCMVSSVPKWDLHRDKHLWSSPILTQQAAANSPPQDKPGHFCSARVTSAAVWGCVCLVPPQEEVTETKQLSQTARSQRRVSLAQQMATRMEGTLSGRLFESCGLQKGLEKGRSRNQNQQAGAQESLRVTLNTREERLHQSFLRQWSLRDQVDCCNV